MVSFNEYQYWRKKMVSEEYMESSIVEKIDIYDVFLQVSKEHLSNSIPSIVLLDLVDINNPVGILSSLDKEPYKIIFDKSDIENIMKNLYDILEYSKEEMSFHFFTFNSPWRYIHDGYAVILFTHNKEQNIQEQYIVEHIEKEILFFLLQKLEIKLEKLSIEQRSFHSMHISNLGDLLQKFFLMLQHIYSESNIGLSVYIEREEQNNPTIFTSFGKTIKIPKEVLEEVPNEEDALLFKKINLHTNIIGFKVNLINQKFIFIFFSNKTLDLTDTTIFNRLQIRLQEMYTIIEQKTENIVYKYFIEHIRLLNDTDPEPIKNYPIRQIFEKLFLKGITLLYDGVIFCSTFKHVPPDTYGTVIDEEVDMLCDIFYQMIKNNETVRKTNVNGRFWYLINYSLTTTNNNIFIGVTKSFPWTALDDTYIQSIFKTSLLYTENIYNTRNLLKMQDDLFSTLGKILEVRDIETKGHADRTTYLMYKMAHLTGIKNIKGAVWGAYLHDIGKIAIPDSILLKPGKLSKEEFEIMKKHVYHGYQMVKNIKNLPEITKNIILYHHEKWDGTGYMAGLSGKNIPMEARIFAIIDVFDALISHRPYKKAWTIEEALDLIKSEKGKHFDPQLVDTFLFLLADKEVYNRILELRSNNKVEVNKTTIK